MSSHCKLASGRPPLEIAWLFVTGPVVTLAACEPEPSLMPDVIGASDSVVALVAMPDSVTLDASDTIQFQAFGLTASGDSVAVEAVWSSDGGEITPDGVFTPSSAAGTFHVFSRLSGSTLADTSQVTVRSSETPPPAVATVEVSPSAIDAAIGDTVRLRATIRDTGGNELFDRPIKWSSSNTSVATVDPQGLLRANAAGTATISASSEGQSGSATVEVHAASPSAGECATPEPEWIWCDDFERDRLSRYFEYVHKEGSFVRAAGVGVEGSYGMRARFAPGQVGAGALHVAFGLTPLDYFEPVDGGTANYREIYWRIYLKNQAGWVGGGGSKLSRAMILASPDWAQAMIAHVWSNASKTEGDYYLLIDPASGTDAAGLVVTTTYNDFGNLRWLGALSGTTPIFDPQHVGAWYCIEARVKLNDAGQANGVFQLWIDEQLEAQRMGLNWVGAFSAFGINAVFFENHWDAGSPAAQERYMDNIVVSTRRIGC
jgi:hypothetical protein